MFGKKKRAKLYGKGAQTQELVVHRSAVVVGKRSARRGRALVTIAAVTLLAMGAALVPAEAVAATASATLTNVGETPFIVPSGVTSVTVTLVGAAGGSGGNQFPQFDAPGGPGALANATVDVNPGEVLFAEVGSTGGAGQIGAGGPGGANGGAAGGLAAGGGGGGGATDVRTCSVTPDSVLDPAGCASISTIASRLAVAGGGGGGGGSSSWETGFFGGGGGAADGGGGSGGAGNAPAGGTGGGPGTLTAGGAPGAYSDSTAAGSGALAAGGGAGDEAALLWGGGGGGGGGLYGGGGGGGGECVPNSVSVCGAGGGGGGGSSGVPTGISAVSGFGAAPAPAGSQPAVTFTWGQPTPTVLSGVASGVTATTATLNGIVDPNGSAITDCHFDVMPGGAQIPCAQHVGSGGMPFAVTGAVSGLTPGTAYTATLVASSAQGTATGEAVEFITPVSRSSTVGGSSAPASGSGSSGGGSGASGIAAVASVQTGGRGVTVTIACNVGPGHRCILDASLLTTERLADGTIVSLARVRKRARRVTVGSRKLTLDAGHKLRLMIPLNQTGTSLLRRFGKLPVQLVITLNAPSGAATVTSQHLTIKPPREHRR